MPAKRIVIPSVFAVPILLLATLKLLAYRHPELSFVVRAETSRLAFFIVNTISPAQPSLGATLLGRR